MLMLVTKDPLGGERFTNRRTGQSCALVEDPPELPGRRQWIVYYGGHPTQHVNRGPFFYNRGSAVSFIEFFLK